MPHMHARDCPVAPVPGLHGGMREHPVPAGRVVRWEHSIGKVWRGQAAPSGVIVLTVDLTETSTAGVDLSLEAFYLPPAQADDKPAHLPVDSDPEMETVAAMATHEPERWTAVRR